jgi:4-nitrophenyl phosphatase
MDGAHGSAFELLNQNYDYFIFDCDGVIWRGWDYIEQGVHTINKLLHLNKKVFFLSNTNSLSRQDLYDKLLKAGISKEHFTYQNVYTSSYLTAKHIQLNYPDIKKVYLIGLSGMRSELENIGLTVSGGSDDNDKSFDYSNPDHYIIDDSLQAVVCGFDLGINFYKLFYASQVINKTKKFFGTNYDNKVVIKGVYTPATYSIISSIEVSTEQKAEIITKPDPRSLNIIMDDHSVDKENLNKFIMIGDTLHTDILFAKNAGIDSLLVFTGNTKEEEFEELKNTNSLTAKPTYTLKSL